MYRFKQKWDAYAAHRWALSWNRIVKTRFERRHVDEPAARGEPPYLLTVHHGAYACLGH